MPGRRHDLVAVPVQLRDPSEMPKGRRYRTHGEVNLAPPEFKGPFSHLPAARVSDELRAKAYAERRKRRRETRVDEVARLID